jgi:hypothetical protein
MSGLAGAGIEEGRREKRTMSDGLVPIDKGYLATQRALRFFA